MGNTEMRKWGKEDKNVAAGEGGGGGERRNSSSGSGSGRGLVRASVLESE